MEFARKFYIIAAAFLLMAILAFPIAGHFMQGGGVSPVYVEEIAEEMEAASSAKICWGLKRGTDGRPPEVGSKAKELLSQHNGLYLGDASEKKIYLTFDEGYENGYTAQILDTLRSKNVKAIFFITGDFFEAESDLVRRMVEEGHEVGNHTMNHPSLTEVSRAKAEQEILELSRQFKDKFGKDMRFLRPPKGEFNQTVLELSQDLSMRCLFWSFAYQDWLVHKQQGPQHALQMVTDNLHNGAVLLLHAVSSDNSQALGDIIDQSRKLGYEFGTPDDLYQVSSRGQP